MKQKASVPTPYCLSRSGGWAQRVDLIIPTEHHRPTLEELERAYCLAIISENGGNLTQAARVLGIGRATLYRLANKWSQTERLGLNHEDALKLASLRGVQP